MRSSVEVFRAIAAWWPKPKVTPAPTTYSIYVECSNCGSHRSEYQVPLGKVAMIYLRTQECPRCGCCTLEQGGYSYGGGKA